jgi:bacillithiol biosynthesis deacetylase BshB1
MTPPLDLLAIGAHPDDVELFAGGTIARLARAGRRVVVLSLTRGEAATRGSVEIRAAEAAEADRILGVAERVTLDLGDSRFENDRNARAAVARELRRLRPAVVMTHDREERHPDHGRARDLVRDACFYANVGAYPVEGERHEVAALVHFLGHESATPRRPDWIVDVTAAHETKMRAVRAYATQFLGAEADAERERTLISRPEFLKVVEARSRLWGAAIGVEFGEAFRFHQAAHADHAFVRMLQ